MKDRIKEIMDNANLTPAKFADQLQINRAVVSHILNGRNNPSLDVVTKILSEMNYINSDWLLNGTGEMYKDGYTSPIDQKDRSLFNVETTNVTDSETQSGYVKENASKDSLSAIKHADHQDVNCIPCTAKKVRQIIIYYTDNTFETFTPH